MSFEGNVSLGNTDIKISSIGLGTMQWGDREVVDINSHTLPKEIFSSSLTMGVNLFDTAEIYGFGKSEKYLGQCYRDLSKEIIIASKFMPFPWRLGKGELRRALKRSLNRLGIERIDLYQIHWPFPPVPIKTWMDAMSDVVEEGLVRSVGVSNYSVEQTRKAFDHLAQHHILLASNQVKFNLLDRKPERSGLLNLCRELGVSLIAYSPLESGILTGKFSHNEIPADSRAWRYNRSHLKKIEPLLIELKTIGNSYGGKTPSQVSLNWLRAKGAIPIPGAKNVEQAKENAGTLGWNLSQDDVERLDIISHNL